VALPKRFPGREEIVAVRAEADELEPGAEADQQHRLAGRVLARRDMGKLMFLDLVDRSGRIQLLIRPDDLGGVNLDLGDIVGVGGVATKTKRGEPSLAVSELVLLGKIRTPLPDTFHGLTDTEQRYRRRYLDLLINEDARSDAIVRSRMIAAIRAYLDDEGFVEVETPVLQPLYGGALARPFITHHNALDRDLYLRIATELYLKRCVVGGIERVYELGKDFRNEGVSFKHNPEFTMLEWYEAYADYEDAAARLEVLVAHVAERVLGTTRVERDGVEIDLAPPWRRLTLRDAILERSGIDVLAHPTREALAAAMDSEASPDDGWGKLVDGLLSKEVEPTLIQPTLIMDYPVEMSPFAKRHRSADGLVERWEAYVGGFEIANAFTELNDPDEQRLRFEQQAEELRRGDDEAQPFDESYVQALEYGMPPTGGVGLGIDRLVMLLTGAKSLREVVLFPAMR
jgi:lysyl-tRNA synthetase, class II